MFNRNDTATLELNIKASNAQAELLKLSETAEKLKTQMRDAGMASEDFIKNKQYAAVVDKMKEHFATLKKERGEDKKIAQGNEKEFIALVEKRYRAETAKLKELQQLQRNLRAELSGTRENDPRKQEIERYLANVETRIAKFKNGVNEVKISMKLDDSLFKNAATIGMASLNQLKNAGAALEHQIQNLNPATIEYLETSKKLILVKDRINNIENSLKPVIEDTFDLQKVLSSLNTSSLNDLKKAASSLENEFSTLDSSSEEFTKKSKEWVNVKQRINDIEKSLKPVVEDIFDLQKVLSNLNVSSLNDLKKAASSLQDKLNNLSPTTKDFITTSKQLSIVNQRLEEVELKSKELNKTLLDGKQILNTAVGFVAGSIASEGLQQVQKTLNAVIDDIRAYGKAVSEMEAITGASGKELKDLEDRATSLTSIMTEGGNVITNTSTDILKAFKLVGSAKPELLGNAEALQNMTKEAIIFAQASGLDLPKSVEVLTTVLEQFDTKSSESSRFMNAMAAGAKEGSVEIPATADAIQKFGEVSKQSNVTIEESVALVQTLSKTFKSGEETGTALRTMMLKLSAPEMLSKDALAAMAHYNVNLNKIKDTTIPLAERLKELKPLANDAGALKAIFEEANVPAASKLLGSIDNFEKLTKSVTGTSEAYRQAGAMSNNLDNDIDNLKDTSTQLFGEFSRTGVPVLRTIIQGFISFLKVIKENWNGIVALTQVLTVVISTIGAYFTGIKIGTAILDLWAKRTVILTALTYAKATAYEFLTDKIKRAAIMQQFWDTVTKLSPWGLVLSAITLIAGAWAIYKTRISDAVQSQRMLNELNAAAQKNIAGQKVELEQLLKVARDEKKSKDERTEAIKKLNALVPEYNNNLSLETINTNEARKATEKYVSSLERKAKAQAALEKRVELEKSMIDLQSGQTDTSPSFMQRLGNTLLSGGSVIGTAVRNAQTLVDNYTEKTKSLKNQIESLDKYIQQNQIDVTGTSSSKKKGVDENTNKFIKGDDGNAKKLSDDIDKQAKRIADIQKDIAALKATEIVNEFDKKKQDSVNKSEAELAQLEQRFKDFEEKAKKQGSKVTGSVREGNVSISGKGVTTQDQTEATLINQETIAIKEALQKQGDSIELERQKSFYKQAEQTSKLATELKSLQVENAKIGYEATKQAMIEGFDNEIDTLKDKTAEKNALLVNQLKNGLIDDKNFAIQKTANEAKLQRDILAVQNKRLEDLKKYNAIVLGVEMQFIRDREQIQKQTVQDKLTTDELQVADDLKKGKIKSDQEANEQIRLLREKAAEETIKIEKNAQSEIDKVKKDGAKNELDLHRQIVTEKQSLNQKELDEYKALQDEKKKKLKEVVDASFEAAKIISDAIFQIESTNAEFRKKKELKSVDEIYDKKIKAAKGNKIQIEKLEKEREEKKQQIEKDAFERNKRLQITQAIMNGAFAITKILAETPKFDFGIATAIGIGLAVATTAAQVATISAQKFEKGGIFNKKAGIAKGASHTEGGIKLLDSTTGSIVGEMEGNEPYLILSKNTYQNNKPLIDALIESSVNRGGAAIMANGGLVQPNEAAASPIRSYVVNNNSSSNATHQTLDISEMVNEIKSMRQAIDRMPKELKAYIKYQDYQEANDLVTEIKNKAFGK